MARGGAMYGGEGAVGANAGALSSVWSSMVGKTNVLLTFTILTLIVIVLVIAYIVWRLVRRDLAMLMLVKSPRKLFNQPTPLTIEGSKMPVTLAGREFGFSMWIYLSDFKVTTQHKLLFMRATTNGSVRGANPIVFLDGSTNRLYVSIATNVSRNDADMRDVLDAQKSKYVTATVEYLPLQRWVHIAFTVKQQLLSVFMDGDLYTVENVGDSHGSSSSGKHKSPRPIFAGAKGDLQVGPVGPDTASTTGYIARLAFYNYAPPQRDISASYSQGPSPKNVLSALGLDEYGIRSPVYKVEGN